MDTMARTRTALVGLILAAVFAGFAVAQPAADRDRQPRSETEGQSPPAGAPNLSRELDRSNGVIRPPQQIDPEMQVTPPDPGSQRTPVIPPPGSPGGNQQIQPK